MLIKALCRDRSTVRGHGGPLRGSFDILTHIFDPCNSRQQHEKGIPEMRLLPSVLNWSYHREYWVPGAASLESYLQHVSTLARKYGFEESEIKIKSAETKINWRTKTMTMWPTYDAALDNLGLQVIPILGTLSISTNPFLE